MTPLYLDFDGVLNSLNGDLQRLRVKTGFGEWTRHRSRHAVDGEDFPLTVSTERNRTLAQLGLVGADFLWLTTWWQAPRDPVERTGIDAPFLCPNGSEADMKDPKWKAKVIRTRTMSGDRFVWIDDDAIPSGFAQEFPVGLLIRPSPRFGLFRRDIARVAAYLHPLHE